MDSLSRHLLASPEELRLYKEKLGEKYNQFETAVHQIIATMPHNVWYNYTHHIQNKANIPLFIKIVCDYIDRYRSLTDYVEFNSDCTRIRRMVKRKKELFDPKKRKTPYTT